MGPKVLTSLALEVNSALDAGKYANVTFDLVAEHIESRTIFEFLGSRLLGDIEVLPLLDDAQKEYLIEEWQGILDAGDVWEHFRVKNNGLCLLLACILGSIQLQENNERRNGS